MAAAAGGTAGGVLVLGLAFVLCWHRRTRASSKLHPQGTVPTPASSSTGGSWFSSSKVASASHTPAKTSRAAALLKAGKLEPTGTIFHLKLETADGFEHNYGLPSDGSALSTSTKLNPKWLRKPLQKALIAPLLNELNGEIYGRYRADIGRI